jgi:hypothetical protein
MRLDDSIADLERAWSDEQGFLFELRMGLFSSKKAKDFLSMIQLIESDDAELVSRRAVSLLWYLPLFLGWQVERVDPKDRAELEKVITSVENHLSIVLGVP